MPKNTQDEEGRSEVDSDETEGHPAMTMGGVAPTKTATDSWVTSQPNPDATHLTSLPKAVADSLDDKDHSDDVIVPDAGGQVLDETAAAANRAGRE